MTEPDGRAVTAADRLVLLIFACTLGMLLSVIAAMFIAEPRLGDEPTGHGFKHPEFGTMRQGTLDTDRHERIIYPATAFGVFEITLFVACLALGASRSENPRKHLGAWLAGGGAMILCFLAMVRSYHAGVVTGDPGWFLGFPAATAWMLYGLWPVPLFFIALFMRIFDRWIATPADEERFAEIMRRRDGGGGSGV